MTDKILNAIAQTKTRDERARLSKALEEALMTFRQSQDATEVAKLKSALAASEARGQDLAGPLRALREAVLSAFGNFEDCDDCADIDTAGEARPCYLHGPQSESLYKAVCAAEDALGPCPCGHTRIQHDEEYERRCLACDCKSFQLPAPPLVLKVTP